MYYAKVTMSHKNHQVNLVRRETIFIYTIYITIGKMT